MRNKCLKVWKAICVKLQAQRLNLYKNCTPLKMRPLKFTFFLIAYAWNTFIGIADFLNLKFIKLSYLEKENYR